jgi:hypothetical protein
VGARHASQKKHPGASDAVGYAESSMKANAGGYYHYGTAGPQVVRCVRGTGTVEMVKDCTVADGCKNW